MRTWLSLPLLTVPLVLSACRGGSIEDDPELCGDDAFAPNSTRITAHELADDVFDGAGTFTAEALPLCQGDEDWFSVGMSAGQRIALFVEFAQADGDIQLDLVTSNGAVIATSQSITDGEYLDVAILETGTYFVRIYGADAGTENFYDLMVERIGSACAEDALEPNNVAGSAVDVPGGVASGLSVCFGEEDWFNVPASDGQVAVVTATFDTASEDLNLTLYREATNGNLVFIGNGTPTGDGVQVVSQISGTGPFVAQVTRGADTLTGAYDIEIEVAGDACITDQFETNDGYLDATPVDGVLIATDLSLCVGDHDWYEVDVANGELLEVEALFDHTEVDIGVQVFKLNEDRTLTYRAGSNTLSDDETVRYRPFDAGAYVVHVYPTRGSVAGEYDLSVVVGGDACIPDSFEPNNAYPEATAIDVGEYGEMTLCVGDDDWFTIDIADGQLFSADLGFEHASNDLGMWLYKLNDDGTVTYRAGSNTLTDNETIRYRPFDGGTHVVRVARSRGTVVATYSLDLDITGEACDPDPLEPNNGYVEATPTDLGDYQNLSLCIGDTDWYQISAENGQVIEADITFSHDANDLGLRIYKLNDDGSISYRAQSNTLSDDESLRYRTFDSGDFLVWVYRTRGTQLADYDMSLDVTGDACIDDQYEPNDRTNQAAPVPLQPATALTMCVGDADWYELTLENGQILDASIQFSSDDTDLGLNLYKLNDDGTITYRAGSNTLSDDEALLYAPFESGNFLLYVYRTRGTQLATYDLDVEIRGESCIEDAFEPNNASLQTADIAPGVYDEVSLCVGDADWYRFEASNGQLISVDLSFIHAQNDLGMRIYSVGDNGLITSRSGADTLSDNEFIRYRPFETGEFLLYVYRSRGTVVADYDLTFDVIGDACMPDTFEPNDHWLQASDLAPNSDNPSLTNCVGDNDYYSLGTMVTGQVINATASFVHADGDLGLQVFRINPDGTYLATLSADSLTDDEITVYTIPDDPAYDGAEYGLRVYRTRGAQQANYGLSVTTTPPPVLP